MAVEQLKFVGINRAISDYSPNSACEELINLRPTTGGLVPVKGFTEKWTNRAYDKLFIHKSGNVTNHIAICDMTAQHAGYGAFLLNENGEPTNSICEIPQAAVPFLSFASAGNVILFSAVSTENNVFFSSSHIWKDNQYKRIEANAPSTPFSFSDQIELVQSNILFANADKLDIVNTVESYLNKVQEENPLVCFGPIIVAVAFKTTDGKTFWTGQWVMYDPLPKMNQASTFIDDVNDLPANPYDFRTAYADFFTAHSYGHKVFGPHNVPTSSHPISVPGTKVSMVFQKLTSGTWSKDTSYLQSIEIYSSRPKLFFDTSALVEGTQVVGYGAGGQIAPQAAVILPIQGYDDMDLGNQLLYHQASIALEDLNQSAQTVTLEFGGNMQLTNDTLEVDAGMVRRCGKVVSYNARFHYFDSVSQTGLTAPSFYVYGSSSSRSNIHVFVRYDNGRESSLIYTGKQTLGTYSVHDVVIAPSINIKEVITYYKNPSQAVWYVTKYPMTPSLSYNYSIFVNNGNLGHETLYTAVTEYENAIAANPNGVSFVYADEPDAINVTEQYNPFVFLVEHSYLMPGKVLGLQPQLATIPDVPNGTYPLNVFTDRGAYALVQGSANVLYGSVQPVSNLVVESNSVSTEQGNFFLAAGALWLIAGLRAVLISDALSLGPHKYIRSCDGFDSLSQNDQVGYDVGHDHQYQSMVPFEEFVNGTTAHPEKAVLAYNRYRDEIFVSNPNYEYTYVLSLKYRQWLKISKHVYQDSVGGNIVLTPGTVSGTKTVLDLENELGTSVLVHLQSRPFTLGYQYIHVHRIVALIRAKLVGTDQLVVALYGSEDLQNWHLLTYSSRSGVQVSQMRTAPAARSWRYYTVCIGGVCPVDTDFGPVLVDYQPVIRRIG